MTIVHRFATGGYIARNGASVEICVPGGVSGMPLVLEVSGEALAAMAAACAAAFRERGKEQDEVAEAARLSHRLMAAVCSPERRPVKAKTVGRAESVARRWKGKWLR